MVKVVLFLKQSKIMSAGKSLASYSSSLFFVMYGTMMFSKYHSIVSSLDQWFGVCVSPILEEI